MINLKKKNEILSKNKMQTFFCKEKTDESTLTCDTICQNKTLELLCLFAFFICLFWVGSERVKPGAKWKVKQTKWTEKKRNVDNFGKYSFQFA